MMKEHLIKPGETLSSIATTYYGHPDAWKYVYAHNRHELPNPNQLPIGKLIVIPHIKGMEWQC